MEENIDNFSSIDTVLEKNPYWKKIYECTPSLVYAMLTIIIILVYTFYFMTNDETNPFKNGMGTIAKLGGYIILSMITVYLFNILILKYCSSTMVWIFVGLCSLSQLVGIYKMIENGSI